jgi:hypothetical protein
VNKFKTVALVAIIALIPLAALAAVALGVTVDRLFPLFACGGLGMAYLVKDADASVKKTKALPATGTTAVATDGIDLGVGAKGIAPGNVEVLLSAPALVVGELADAATVAYTLYHSDAADFDPEVSLYGTLITQTGADGAGAAAATKRVRLPSDCKRYIRAKGDPSASTDKSAKSFSIELLF